MSHRILITVCVSLMIGRAAFAEDEVFLRSKEKPMAGVVKSESSRGIQFEKMTKGSKAGDNLMTIMAENIIDISYDVTPVELRINVYRPAVRSEKDYNDPDPKKDAKRKTNLASALKGYMETHAKAKEKYVRRHMEYKIAVLTARQALDDGLDTEQAVKLLQDFKAKQTNSWQIGDTLQVLGKLQTEGKHYQDAEATYLDLAKADVGSETKQEAELLAAQMAAKGGKHQAALERLQGLAGKLPKESKYQGRVKIAQAECLLAAKKDPEGVALLRQVALRTLS